MKQVPFLPYDHVFWSLPATKVTPLRQDIQTDVVVVGGGMAGLSAAQAFRSKGCDVVLVEKNYCGSGASGKSSGFITPDSELSLYNLIQIYGQDEAHALWEFVTSGVKFIKKNITDYKLDCGYFEQDTLIVANSASAFRDDIQKEYVTRQKLGYTGTLYSQQDVTKVLGSTAYKGGVSYGDTFCIQAQQYCWGMRDVLRGQGVQIYEETPVVSLRDHQVTTPGGVIRAKHIIVCADYASAYFTSLRDLIYHVQTFLLLSAPLSHEQIKKIFPDKPMMVWDTDLVYQYFRLTADNRLLVGGSTLLCSYDAQEHHNNQSAINNLTNYFATKFPDVDLTFEYVWPGLIGISKDIFPLAGFDRDMPSVFYATATVGLPWAASLGNYSAECVIDGSTTFAPLFSPYRSFKIGGIVQKILGKRITFSLSNMLTAKGW